MQLDNDTVIRLGEYCQSLLGDPDFNTLSNMFEAREVSSMLATKRDATKQREEHFATLLAVRAFVEFMADLVRSKNELTEPKVEDTTDDPRVHDIHDYED